MIDPTLYNPSEEEIIASPSSAPTNNLFPAFSHLILFTCEADTSKEKAREVSSVYVANSGYCAYGLSCHSSKSPVAVAHTLLG